MDVRGQLRPRWRDTVETAAAPASPTELRKRWGVRTRSAQSGVRAELGPLWCLQGWRAARRFRRVKIRPLAQFRSLRLVPATVLLLAAVGCHGSAATPAQASGQPLPR